MSLGAPLLMTLTCLCAFAHVVDAPLHLRSRRGRAPCPAHVPGRASGWQTSHCMHLLSRFWMLAQSPSLVCPTFLAGRASCVPIAGDAEGGAGRLSCAHGPSTYTCGWGLKAKRRWTRDLLPGRRLVATPPVCALAWLPAPPEGDHSTGYLPWAPGALQGAGVARGSRSRHSGRCGGRGRFHILTPTPP